MLVLKGLKVFIEPFNFTFFSITGQDIDLYYHDIKWVALETNRDHSFVFEIASKYCILDSFVDYDGYCISSKGFLSTVADKMNSMKRQNNRILNEELPRSVGAQYATGDQWTNNSRKNEGMEPK